MEIVEAAPRMDMDGLPEIKKILSSTQSSRRQNESNCFQSRFDILLAITFSGVAELVNGASLLLGSYPGYIILMTMKTPTT
jgi:hypothetical protein